MVNHPNRSQIPLILRQGDVLIREVGHVPSDAREIARDEHRRIVLAHGEKTGHAHAFRAKNICSLSTLDDDDIEFLLVGGSGAKLRHELVSGARAEHAEITVPAAKYEAAVQVEYTPAELFRVTD